MLSWTSSCPKVSRQLIHDAVPLRRNPFSDSPPRVHTVRERIPPESPLIKSIIALGCCHFTSPWLRASRPRASVSVRGTPHPESCQTFRLSGRDEIGGILPKARSVPRPRSTLESTYRPRLALFIVLCLSFSTIDHRRPILFPFFFSFLSSVSNPRLIVRNFCPL